MISASRNEPPQGERSVQDLSMFVRRYEETIVREMFVQELVEQAMDRWDGGDRWDEDAKNGLLLGTMKDNFELVSKNAMITALKKDEELITKWVNILESHVGIQMRSLAM